MTTDYQTLRIEVATAAIAKFLDENSIDDMAESDISPYEQIATIVLAAADAVERPWIPNDSPQIDEAALLPCPFCGNAVLDISPNFGFPFIRCETCNMDFDFGIEECLSYEDYEVMKGKWNTRAAQLPNPKPPKRQA